MTVAEFTAEDELAVAAIRGSEEAFSAIYDVLSVRIFNYVLRTVHERSTAEDVCQEVWLKAHREIRTLKSPQALRTWLFRMASRACIDYSRSRTYRERGSPEVTEEMLEAASDEPEAVALRQGELRLMWEALAALPPRQSMALYLKQVDGCSYDEIGRILGCPKSAVETLLFRARHGLARTHERFQADPKARCKMIGATMSIVLDKEGTPFQERAVNGHLAECRSCRDEIAGMKRGVAGYAWLPMLPVGGQALSAALAGGTAGAGFSLGISRIVGMLMVNGKASGLIALTVGAVATTGVAGAATGLTPSPLDAFGVVEEIGTAVRNVTTGGGDEDASSSRMTIQSGARPPLAPVQTQPSGGALPSQQPLSPLPPASQLDPISSLSGLTGLLEGASTGTLASVEPLLAFVGGTLGGVLEDPLAVLQRLLSDPGGTVDGLANDATKAINETTQNTTTTVDDTVDQTTDIVDGLLGENELTGSLDQTVDDTTDVVDGTVGGVTGIVDETTGGLDETLDGLLGDEGILGGDDGLLGGLGGGSSEEDGGLLDPLLGGGDEEEEPPPCIPIPLLVTC